MCNIAGYIGTQTAAPILIRMMQRQEGLNGGFYTGIATLHENKIHHAKRTGNTQHLLDTTNAAFLPGTVGIMHSRTNDGGGDEWAHPFIGYHGDVAALAYVANGSTGYFLPRLDEYKVLVESLLKEGYQIHRKPHTDNKPYLVLSDGTHVHMSDAMCQLILRNIDRGHESADAMASAFCEMPAEIVGLAIDSGSSDRITWTRINKPMYVCFATHGAYLASTPMAFPDDVITEPQLLPACAAGYIYQDQFTVKPFHTNLARMAPVDIAIQQSAYEMVCRRLEKGNESFAALSKMMQPLFEKWDIAPIPSLVYDILYSLQKQGRLKIESYQVPAARENLNAYQYRLSLEAPCGERDCV